MTVAPNVDIDELIEKINNQKLQFMDSPNKKKRDLHEKLMDLLAKVSAIRSELSPEEFSEMHNDLILVLSSTIDALENWNNPQLSIINAKNLADLSIHFSEKSSPAWKNLGTSLLFVASAVLVVAGVLLAIPSGGSSLLLSAIGAVGLTASTGIGIGVAATGVMGAAALYHGREKGLVKVVNSLSESLNEMALDDELLSPSTSVSSSGSSTDQDESSLLSDPNLSELSIPESSEKQQDAVSVKGSESTNPQNQLPQSLSADQELSASVRERQEEKKHTSISAVVSDVVYKQIMDTINSKENAKHDANFSEISSESTEITLKDLEQNLRVCERLKHPYPIWNYTRIEPKEVGEKAIIKIRYTPTPTNQLTDEQLDLKTKYSIMTRKLSIIGGVLTLLECSNEYLTADPTQKENIRKKLAELSNDVIRSKDNAVVLDSKVEINNFVERLARTLETITNPKPANIIRDIREAERYFVAEHNKNQILIVEIPKGNKTIIQMDIELNHQLTEPQKESYLAIHDEEKPKWFITLTAAEQAWYLQRIPKRGDSDAEQKWNDFQLLFKSSAMTHTPGIPNARVNYLMQKKRRSRTEGY